MTENFFSNEEIDDIHKKISEIRSACLDYDNADPILNQLDQLQSLIEKKTEDEKNALGVSAQVSLYPLRQKSLTPAINEALDIFKQYNLEIKMGSMSTLIVGKDIQIWESLKTVFNSATRYGETVMMVTISNACPLPSKEVE
jgi:uncharacterized protein YqgV (UPF0045/DUF77 family)